MGAGQDSGSLCPRARQEGWEKGQLQGQMETHTHKPDGSS